MRNYTLYNRNNNGNKSNDINNSLLTITMPPDEGSAFRLSIILVGRITSVARATEVDEVTCREIEVLLVVVVGVVFKEEVVVDDNIVTAVDDFVVAIIGGKISGSKGSGVINGALFGRILYCLANALINDSTLYDSELITLN